MKKILLEAYALVVCFVTLICFMVALAMAMYSVVQIKNPIFTIDSSRYEKYQSNDLFWADKQQRRGYEFKEKLQQERPDETQLTKERVQAFVSAIAVEKRDGFQMLFKLLIVMLLDIIVFLVHWIIARRTR